MKKISNLLIAAIALVILSLSSCNNVKPKEVSLNTLNDSINYTLGLWQGSVFKTQYFANDEDGKKLDAFVKALDKAYASGEKSSELYDLGVQVGKYFNENTKNGYFGDSTLVGDNKLILAGLINAIKDYQDVMSSTEADSIMQVIQTKVSTRNMQAPQN